MFDRIRPVEYIRNTYPCNDGYRWLAPYTDPLQAWQECHRGDWMMWYLGHTVTRTPWCFTRRPLLACALDCILTLESCRWDEDTERITDACTTLLAWTRGEISTEIAQRSCQFLDVIAGAHVKCYPAGAACYAIDNARPWEVWYAFDETNRTVFDSPAIIRKHFPTPPELHH